MKGLAKYHGCPIPDSDGDGINDEEDLCPNKFGIKANNGCPIDTIEIKKAVEKKKSYFEFGKIIINDEAKSSLDSVTVLLAKSPSLTLEIQGHTDNIGSDRANEIISQKRAETVKQYLISKGVSGDRLEAVGYGKRKPIVSNATIEGRARNRRVELHVKQ